MENIILHTDEKKASAAYAQLKESYKQVSFVWELLNATGFVPAKKDIELVILNSRFDNVVKWFEEQETQKIKNIIDSFGETAITDGWEEKVTNKTETFKRELIAKYRKVDPFVRDYLQYFDYSNGISINPMYNLDYFRSIYSVVLENEKQIEFYEKHKMSCQLLNDLMNHPENEYKALGRLFFFNEETKEFELNMEAYL